MVKTPRKEQIPLISEKTPDDLEKQFNLPPSRKSTKTYRKTESILPSNKGSLPKSKRKKDPVNRMLPKQIIKVQESKSVPPTRRGIFEKKQNRISNKTPPRTVFEKRPQSRTKMPPTTLKSTQKSKKNIRSKKPPKSTIEKPLIKSKSIPPSIIRKKIPKITIKDKKPE
jgi:hypothetical protein